MRLPTGSRGELVEAFSPLSDDVWLRWCGWCGWCVLRLPLSELSRVKHFIR